MEVLNVLEKKIASLVELVQLLKTEKATLAQENRALEEKLGQLEHALLAKEQDVQEQSQEVVLTKMMVDDLIKHIDHCINQEQQQ